MARLVEVPPSCPQKKSQKDFECNKAMASSSFSGAQEAPIVATLDESIKERNAAGSN